MNVDNDSFQKEKIQMLHKYIGFAVCLFCNKLLSHNKKESVLEYSLHDVFVLLSPSN